VPDPTAPSPDPSLTQASPLDTNRVDLSTPTDVHVVGVGGAGMSAIASVLAWMGHRVSGSDLKASSGLDRLRALGVTVVVGHDAANLRDASVVTVSTAIPDTNVEVVAARARGTAVLRRSEMLASIAAIKRTVAVAGTHGKTTTSSMLALVLREGGLEPSCIIGGDVNEVGGGAVWAGGDWFVVEADESDGTFLALGAEAVVVTNIEPDHLEHYGGFAALSAAFERFVRDATGPRVLCIDDVHTAALVQRLRADGLAVVTYGTADDADYRMSRKAESGTVTIEHDGVVIGSFALPVPGLHNARNATAAFVVGVLLGAAPDAASRALSRFAGVARRFEQRGNVAGITLIDDYAHLPTEVAAAIQAAREGAFRRVVVVFQPHRYSRTESLWAAFADAFVEADVLAVTDVYASGEQPRPGVTGKLVVNAVLDAHPWAHVAYVPHRADQLAFLVHELRPGDLCLTLGAGDLTALPDELLTVLTERAARHGSSSSSASAS
jgi:UDP-N-acetylmuramate--alanine ligase